MQALYFVSSNPAPSFFLLVHARYVHFLFAVLSPPLFQFVFYLSLPCLDFSFLFSPYGVGVGFCVTRGYTFVHSPSFLRALFIPTLLYESCPPVTSPTFKKRQYVAVYLFAEPTAWLSIAYESWRSLFKKCIPSE